MEDLNSIFDDLNEKSNQITELQVNFVTDNAELKETAEALIAAVDSLLSNDSIAKIFEFKHPKVKRRIMKINSSYLSAQKTYLSSRI